MPSTYQERSTEELIRALIACELRVPVTLAEEICNRPDSVPHLARIIEDDNYWARGGPGDTWSPIHTLHLLGCIKTAEALHVLTATLRDRGRALGDWLTEDMPSIFAAFGSSALAPLTELILDKGLNEFVRAATARALVVIAFHHPECRESLLKLFKRIIKEANANRAEEMNSDFITLFVDDLAEFKDQEAFEDIKLAFANGLVDEFFVTFEDIKRIYNEPDEEMHYHQDEQDPLDHFSPQNIEKLYTLHYGEKIREKQRRIRKVEGAMKKKIGRNDPCPCGSGKKYKKCCLGKYS